MSHTPEEYAWFIEDMLRAGVKTREDFKKWAGYSPSSKQQMLLLARSQREKWQYHYKKTKLPRGRGHYKKVIRDKRGRFVSWKIWTWKRRK